MDFYIFYCFEKESLMLSGKTTKFLFGGETYAA